MIVCVVEIAELQKHMVCEWFFYLDHWRSALTCVNNPNNINPALKVSLAHYSWWVFSRKSGDGYWRCESERSQVLCFLWILSLVFQLEPPTTVGLQCVICATPLLLKLCKVVASILCAQHFLPVYLQTYWKVVIKVWVFGVLCVKKWDFPAFLKSLKT